MLTRNIRSYVSWPIEGLARLLASTGIPPNVITWSALAANLCAGVLFAEGRFPAGGGMVIVAALCDLLDGPVARLQNRVSLFGGFLDSILDRYADFLLFLGLLVYYVEQNRFRYAVLAGAAMAGAVMISYAKARAASLVPESDVGFWDRPERLVLIILAALANRMGLALWILAIGPNITVVHRIVHTWKQAEARGNTLPQSANERGAAPSRVGGGSGAAPPSGRAAVQSKAAQAGRLLLRARRHSAGREQ
ncbi:MAG: CDP-alcohol phosphatidyltransferase family protein [Acidobacteriota bacterium]|nr:CDP-alcohol phosphatidyltransferase family protein [Acidobacteriota bacterium]